MSSRRHSLPTLELLDAGERERGRGHAHVFELNERMTLIGRSTECTITLADHMVSKRHARIVRTDLGFTIEDLDSRNHTYVDDIRLGAHLPIPLHDGAVIRICEMKFLFRNRIVTVVEEDPADSSSTILGVRDLTPPLEMRPPGADPDEALRALVEFQRAIGGSLDLDAILQRALETLFSIFPQAECGFLLLRDEKGDDLVPKAIRCRCGAAEDLTISRTILHHVVQEKKAILSADAGSDPLFHDAQSVQFGTMRTVMCAPILDRRGEAVGIVQMDTRSAKASFGTRELDLLSGLASQVGVAIELARLHEIESKHYRAEREQRFARDVQMALLPHSRPSVPGYRFWDFYEPAKNVGGDYFDYIPLERPEAEGDTWAVAVGDVAGKGLPAALMMAKLGSDVLMSALAEVEPARVIERLNRRLCDARLPERYVTLLWAVLDTRTHRGFVVNAGHTCPYLRRADGRVEAIGEGLSGMMLGVDETEAYRAAEFALDPGDALLLFTDGVNEAMNPKGQLLGLPRLVEAIRTAPLAVDQIGNNILKAVRSHASGNPQSDDIALVCFGRLA